MARTGKSSLGAAAKLLGKHGGKKRASTLDPKRRQEIARSGGKAKAARRKK